MIKVIDIIAGLCIAASAIACAGPSGPTGDRGPNGLAGPGGSVGARGERGERGERGPQGEASAEVTRAGSRLVARFRVLTTADGATLRRFSGWYDTARGEACAERWAGDGRLRCLPAAHRLSPSTFFWDAACKERIFVAERASACTPAPKYYTIEEPGVACAPGTQRLYPASAPIVPADYYREPTPGACERGSAPWKEPTPAVKIGLEIAPSDFVELVQTTE